MTRDEAIEIAKRNGDNKPWYEGDVDTFVALGMLKLDDPNAKMRDNAALVLEGRRYDGAFITGTAACQMIDSLLINGFKITR